MKLLLDNNISRVLAVPLESKFSGTKHVSEFGLSAAHDDHIWEFAKYHGYCILSKDSDFRNKSFLRGFPPKVIWISPGECSTDGILSKLTERYAEIMDFLKDSVSAIMILYIE